MSNRTPNERLKEYIYSVARSINQFANLHGFAPAAISRVTSGVSVLTPGMAARILSACPDLSEEWLWHGTGPMTRPASVVLNLSGHARAAAHDYHEHHTHNAPSLSSPASSATTSSPTPTDLDLIRARLDTIERLLSDTAAAVADQSLRLDSLSSLSADTAASLADLRTRLNQSSSR